MAEETEQTQSKSAKRRAYCFTHFHWDDKLKTKLETGKQVKYYIAGHEICPTTKRPHMQGYIYFFNAKTMGQASKYLGCTVKPAFGDIDQNTAYCSKDENYIEWGEKPRPGARNDLTKIKKALLVEGEPLKKVVLEQCSNYQELRYAEGLMKYTTHKIIERQVKWFWGPTGCGKTHRAMTEALEMCDGDLDEIWISGNDLKWWEGYHGQNYVILDEFRADFCKFHELLRILDKYPFRGEIKGSSIQITAPYIWITAPMGPEEMYASRTEEQLGQLVRRIAEIRQFRIRHTEVKAPRRTMDNGSDAEPSLVDDEGATSDTGTAVGGNINPDPCVSDDEA